MSTAPLHLHPQPLQYRSGLQSEPAPATDEQVLHLYAEAARRGARLDRAAHYAQGSLAVDFRTRDNDPHFGPQATPSGDLPEVEPWATGLIRSILECCSGGRPPRQLVRWMTPECHQQVSRRFTVAQRRGGATLRHSRVQRVRVCRPRDGVAEVSAVVHHEGRPRAIALRLNGADGRWVATEMLLG